MIYEIGGFVETERNYDLCDFTFYRYALRLFGGDHGRGNLIVYYPPGVTMTPGRAWTLLTEVLRRWSSYPARITSGHSAPESCPFYDDCGILRIAWFEGDGRQLELSSSITNSFFAVGAADPSPDVVVDDQGLIGNRVHALRPHPTTQQLLYWQAHVQRQKEKIWPYNPKKMSLHDIFYQHCRQKLTVEEYVKLFHFTEAD
jgi:hypothetical protein